MSRSKFQISLSRFFSGNCVFFSKDETYQLHFGESNQKVNDLKKLVPKKVSSLDLQHHCFVFRVPCKNEAFGSKGGWLRQGAKRVPCRSSMAAPFFGPERCSSRIKKHQGSKNNGFRRKKQRKYKKINLGSLPNRPESSYFMSSKVGFC